MGEEMIRWYSITDPLKYLIFRFFNAAGAIDGIQMNSQSHLIPAISKALIENTNFKVFGTDYDTLDGSCIRDYIHVSDIAEGIIKGIDYLLAHRQSATINLGSGKGYSVLEVVAAAKKLGELTVDILPKRPGDVSTQFANTKKAEELLAFYPTHSLDDIIDSDYRQRASTAKKDDSTLK
jgi:UDP-glucose 4-epimerase